MSGWLDPVVFARRRLGFIADDVQARVLRCEGKRVLLNCARQWGKSTVAALRALHWAWTHPEGLVVAASPSGRQSGELVRKVEGFIKRMGERVRGDGDNDISVLLPNGARIVGLPGNDGTIRGFSGAGLVLIDEAARAKQELYEAVGPMVAVSGGALWMMSTPAGRCGFFWREWTGCENWERIAVKAEECGRYPAGFLERERRRMTERSYRQEYGCEFAEVEGAFLEESVLEEAVRDDLGVLVK